jgi:hypothetical protein
MDAKILSEHQTGHVVLHHGDESKSIGVVSFDPILSLGWTKVSSDTLPYPNLAHSLSRHVMGWDVPSYSSARG